MSQTESDLEQYRGTAGAEVKTADVSDDKHALKQKLGSNDDAKERKYDPKIAGERFVQFYDDTAAAIREYLSNAETACVRRARHELLDAGFTEDEIPDETVELLDMAETEVGYEPLIEVTYNRKSDETRLIIEDNGIGISVEEYQVVQRIGYSTSHDEGSRLGNFGMGWMSGFQLTSINGFFTMSTRSYITDEAYSTQEFVANCEYLDYAPDEYGTAFYFPSFGEAAKDIDIPNKVAEFADGMSIPVLYRDFDASGDETNRSDDFLATHIEDEYPDDSLVVTFENEYFKAVMSPDSKEVGRGLHTFNISMPIRRNLDSWSTNDSFKAPWKWDFRGKQENGPIVTCESDDSIVGLIPKEDTKYDRLMEDFQEKCIPMSQVPDDAIVMPEPASSRDSFKSGHDDFWRHVSERLMDAWSDIARERFEQLDSWDAFESMTREEKEGLFRAYDHFGPRYSETEPETVQEQLEDELGVTLDLDICEKIHESQRTVQVVRRGSSRAHTKKATRDRKIWKVIDAASDGVYMGKTISQKKAEIVWGLGDTELVRLDGRSYDELESAWGWEKAKDLPTRNLEEKLPELDQDIIDQYENTSASSSNNTDSTGGDGNNPGLYRTKVRVGTNSRRYYSVYQIDELIELLEDGDRINGGHYRGTYLIINKEDKSARQVASDASRYDDVVATRVPEYVYDHLVGTKNVYESKAELYKDQAGADVELTDGTVMDIRDVPSDDVLLCVGDRIKNYFDDRREDLVDLLGFDPDDYNRFSFIKASDLNGSWEVGTDATVIRTSCGGSFDDFNDDCYKSESFADLKFEDQIGDLDESSDEYEALFGYRRGRPNGDVKETLIEIAQQAGLTE